MRLSEQQRKELIIKASIEISPLYKYTIKNSGLGPALIIDASTKEKASIARKSIPGTYEGLYTIVIYSSAEEEDRDAH